LFASDDIVKHFFGEGGKQPQIRDGKTNLEEADRPDFESFRIAGLWGVGETFVII
jgi:hypothetical protein